MNLIYLAGLLGLALLALPFAIQLYFQRLPVAPACPSCSATTHAAATRCWPALDLVPSLVATYVGECARCGWRGRLRWRWATHPVRRRDG